MPFITILILICTHQFVTLFEAFACDHIWGLLVAPRVHVDPGSAAWFGVLVIWGLMTYGLQRSKRDGDDALEGHADKWGVIKAYAVIQGRMLIAIGIAMVVARGMHFVMGW